MTADVFCVPSLAYDPLSLSSQLLPSLNLPASIPRLCSVCLPPLLVKSFPFPARRLGPPGLQLFLAFLGMYWLIFILCFLTTTTIIFSSKLFWLSLCSISASIYELKSHKWEVQGYKNPCLRWFQSVKLLKHVTVKRPAVLTASLWVRAVCGAPCQCSFPSDSCIWVCVLEFRGVLSTYSSGLCPVHSTRARVYTHTAYTKTVLKAQVCSRSHGKETVYNQC